MTDFSIFIFCFIFCDFNHKISNKFNCYALRTMGPDQPQQHFCFSFRLQSNGFRFRKRQRNHTDHQIIFISNFFCVCVCCRKHAFTSFERTKNDCVDIVDIRSNSVVKIIKLNPTFLEQNRMNAINFLQLLRQQWPLDITEISHNAWRTATYTHH